LDHEWFPSNSMANIETLAATLPMPSYAIDDQTAVRVTGNAVDVISEGNWKLMNG
jgi:dipeptidase E